MFLRTPLIYFKEIWLLVFLLLKGISTILRYDLDWGSLADNILSKLEESEFLIYFSISWRSEPNETLLVIKTIPLSLTCMKLANVLDLIALKAQLILVTYELESLQQALGGHGDPWLGFVVWSIDYFLYLFDFLVGEVQKHLLNLQCFLDNVLWGRRAMMIGWRSCICIWLLLLRIGIFLKYFKISLTFLCILTGIEGRTGEMNVGFAVSFFFLLMFKFLGTWGVNLELTLFLNIVRVIINCLIPNVFSYPSKRILNVLDVWYQKLYGSM